MDKELIYCPHCQKETEHTRIMPALAVCAVYGCGHESRGRHKKNKETKNMSYKKLSEQEIAELLNNWAAVPDEEKNQAAKQSLADKFGVSLNTIIRKLSGDAPVKTRKTSVKKPKKELRPAPAGGVFHDAVSRIVDARLESGLSALRAEIPALVAAEMKKLMSN